MLYTIIEIIIIAADVLAFLGTCKDAKELFVVNGKLKVMNLFIFIFLLIVALAYHNYKNPITVDYSTPDHENVTIISNINNDINNSDDTNINPTGEIQSNEQNDVNINPTDTKTDNEQYNEKIEIPQIGWKEYNAISQDKPDVSDYTTVTDTMSYDGQIREYIYTPKLDGKYRFTISNIPNGNTLSIRIYDEYGYDVRDGAGVILLDGGYGVGLGAVESAELKSGKKYTIKIFQKINLGDFSIQIVGPKTETDISNYTVVQDAIEYQTQKNSYTYEAKSSGKYELEVIEAYQGTELTIQILNHFDEEVKKNIFLKRNDKMEFELNQNEKYKIIVSQSNSDSFTKTLTYTFRIKQMRNSINQ